MIVNKVIKETFKAISSESITLANTKNDDSAYIKRLITVFNRELNSEEQVFVVSYLIHNLHFKNIMLDDDNLLAIANIKSKQIFLIFTLSIILMFMLAAVFNSEGKVATAIYSVLDIFSLIFSK